LAAFHDPGTESAPLFCRELPEFFGRHSAVFSGYPEIFADLRHDVKNFLPESLPNSRVAGRRGRIVGERWFLYSVQ
jgi:hypothetical protein